MELYLNEYIKLRNLGEGSFANVYLVRHHALGYIRALKVSKDNIDSEDDKKWQKFMKECRLLLKIGNGGHPNIVKIYQPRLVQNRAVVEMDYVEGDSLHHYIERHPFLPFDEVWRFVRNIVGAMAYCHVDVYRYLMDPKEDGLTVDPDDGRKYTISREKEKELIRRYAVCHNDLHASNIMRREWDGEYVLLDFGLAIQNKQAVNSTNKDNGAVEYSAPEKFDKLEPTLSSDVYSLGILLYKVLTGTVPFPLKGKTRMAENDVWQAHKKESPPAILPLRRRAFECTHPGMEYTPDYPKEMDDIIMKCLAKQPEERFKNAKELWCALKEAYTSFDERSYLDITNLKLSNQLALAYDRIADMELSVRQKEDELNRKDARLNAVQHEIASKTEAIASADRSVAKWRRLALLLPIVLALGLSAMFLSFGRPVKGSDAFGRSTVDTALSAGDGKQIAERIIRDTIKIEVPKIVTETEPKIEYRTSPKVQQELDRLRNENRKLQGQVQRYKESLPK